MPSVVFALLDDERRVLMESRPVTDTYFPGEWVFPGGKFDPGETDPHAVMLREVTEELGITVLGYAQLLGDRLYYPAHRHEPYREVHPFLVDRWEGSIPAAVLDTGHELAWVPLSEVSAAPCGCRAEIAERLRALLQVA